jgi:3-deoxy-D-manno-octulosonate 8-phosphate phosphatase (KDO 8-P phosphatase)
MSSPDPEPDVDLAGRCAAIELMVIDVDGVLTDGTIALDDHGNEVKHFHVRDGWALAAWRQAGKRTAILSGRVSRAVTRRAAELGIETVVQGAGTKSGPFRAILAEMGLEPHQAGYIGDDLPDLPPMAAAGLSACPADAAEEVRRAARFVTRAPGGRGAVREVIELVLKHQGAWDRTIAPYLGPDG